VGILILAGRMFLCQSPILLSSAVMLEAKKRIRLLEQEAEVMRRAVAYLSRDVTPK